jgi:ferredoxin
VSTPLAIALGASSRKVADMQVFADADRCCGSAQCVLIAPLIFTHSESSGTVAVIDSNPPEALQDDAREAELACPVQAISLEE